MTNIYEFDGYKPVIKQSSFIHPQATIMGNVIIGEEVYVGPGARIRGDWGKIVIHDGCNIQENCTIHMFPGKTVTLEESAHLGHGCVVHGSTLGKNCLIGMNAVIMDRVRIGAHSIVGALTFVQEGTTVPDRKVIAGNPGEIVRDVSDQMLEWKSTGTELYRSLPSTLHKSFKPCRPLRNKPSDRSDQPKNYPTWQEWQNRQNN